MKYGFSAVFLSEIRYNLHSTSDLELVVVYILIYEVGMILEGSGVY